MNNNDDHTNQKLSCEDRINIESFLSGIIGRTEGKNYANNVKLTRDAIVDVLNSFQGNASDPKSLKGYIAEAWHGRTYNLNAAQQGSSSFSWLPNSKELGSVDIKTNFGKDYGLKYFADGKASAKAQAQTVAEGIYRNHPRWSVDQFRNYLTQNGISDDAFSQALYEGQYRLIPSDQLETARDYLKRKIGEEEALKSCLCAVYLQLEESEFKDIVEIIRYITNESLHRTKLISERTIFLEGFYQRKYEEDNLNIDRQWDIDVFFKADSVPLIYIKTFEDEEALNMIKRGAEGKFEALYIYDVENGLKNLTTGVIAEKNPGMKLGNVLEHISESIQNPDYNAVFIFRTIEDDIKDQRTIGKLKVITEEIIQRKSRVVMFFISQNLEIAPDLEQLVVVYDELGYPTLEEIHNIIEKFIDDKKCQSINDKELNNIAYDCKGLTRHEIKRVLNLAYAKLDGDLLKSKELIQNEKKQYIKKSGLLEIIEPTEDINSLCGLAELKTYLKKKADIVSTIAEAKQNHVDMPKGILLVGMPGCGKSLCAKVTPKLFKMPLLRLDVGSLLDKYVGESEHNFNKALKLTEAMSPCVMWIDEFEKAFGGSSDKNNKSEVSSRIQSSLLFWMQEHKADVFIIATANHIDRIDMEDMRAGRIDDIFFVDFPDYEERVEILKFLLNEKGIFFNDVKKVAKETGGYSGSELKRIVDEVNEDRYHNKISGAGTQITMTMFKSAIDKQPPLSITRKKDVDEIRNKCKESRIRRANDKPKKKERDDKMDRENKIIEKDKWKKEKAEIKQHNKENREKLKAERKESKEKARAERKENREKARAEKKESREKRK